VKLKLIVAIFLLVTFSCSRARNDHEHENENKIGRSQSNPFTTTIDSHKITPVKDSLLFTGIGAVMNGSNRTLKDYRIIVMFRLIADSGKEYLLGDNLSRSTTTIDEESGNWNSETEKHFTINYIISRKDMQFKANTVYLIYWVKGVDSNGKEVNEIAGEGELTDIWHDAQAKKTNCLKSHPSTEPRQ